MNNTIDITFENTGVVMEVENFDTENNTILVSLSKGGVDVDVDSVAPSITVDFGSLPQNVYWDEIQDKPNFHPVATSGDYDDLENKPNLHPVATSGDYDDLENKPNLSEVATSGNYGDLNGKPSINNVTLNGNKSAADLGLATASQGAKADTAYQKPVDGIPSSDMTAAVRESLGKADTALQEHQSLEGYATETWVEDQGYLTEHQDISGKQDTLVSGTNIKTINGESILGSGNMVIQGGGGGGTGDYNELENKPSINNVTLSGNKTAAQLGLQETLTIDATPTEDSTNPVQSGGVFTALANLIADGCIYGGKVNPNSTPSADKRLFYIAEQEGTYTNFDNIYIAGAYICILSWNAQLQAWNLTAFGITENAVDMHIDQRFLLLYGDLGFDVFLSSQSYSVGDYVTNFQIGGLYRFTSNHSGAWDDNDVEEVTLIDYIDDLLSGVNNKADKVGSATAGDFAGLDSNGNLTDSGYDASDFATASQGTKADNAIPMPSGGSTGQVLKKTASGVEWANESGGGGTATDVQINGTSITSNDVANIITEGTYNASTNKIATMSDLPSVPVTDVTVGGTSVVSSGTAVIPAIPDVSNYVQKSQTAGLLKNDGTVDTTSYGTYSKPSGGIPASDLASGVIPSVPVTDVTVGGTSVVSSGTAVIPAIPDVTGKADKVSSATNGNFAGLDANGNLTDSGHKHSDYLTSHQDISGKEDKTNKVTSLSSSSTDTQYPSAKVVYDQLATKQATLVSGTNIKTVNSTSLLGSGNITINDGVGFQTITTQQDGTMVITLTNGDTITVDLNHTHPNYYKKTAETSQPQGGMLPDVIYTLGTLTGATTFTFAAAVSGNLNHYYFTFTSGSTAVVPTWPASITSWDGNCVDSTTGLPVIAASKTYEVSVIDGNAFIKEW